MEALILLAWLALCTWHDLAGLRISNWLTLGGCAVALACLLGNGQTWLGASPAAALGGLALALLLGLPGYALRRFGAGDVKLLSFIALAATPGILLRCVAAAGIVLALWALASRPLWPRLPGAMRTRLHYLAPENLHGYPFSPFLFIGYLISCF
ncbi:prepilin peptidase [Pseudomonas sp. LRF_L74]|uniref:prepilin peptidase n=1 Tax=Pseudomonas sp. LRF_L74 TaxID=3369422 RepID=UPI003F616382